MPNIPTFDTPALGLRPTETGVETVAGNARRMGAFFNQQAGALEGLAGAEKNAFGSVGRALGSGVQAAGDAYVNYLDHKEISAGAAKGTELMATLSDQWNKTISDPKLDPNDPTIKQKFMEQNLEPALQQFKDDSGFFTTEKSQQFAEQFVDRFRQHMSDKTSADMSTLAGIALKVNVQKTVNALSSMVSSDPSALDTALATAEHTIGAKVDSSPTLDATTAASVRGEVGQKAKQDIVRSAVIGMIQKNPNVDLDAIQKKYGDYINGAEMKQFQKAAQTQAKVDLLQQKQAEAYQHLQQERAAAADLSKTFSDTVSIDENGKPTINPQFFSRTLDVEKKYPGAASASVRAMINWAEAQQNKELKPVTDPAIQSDLYTRMFSTDKPTTKAEILTASAQNKLDPHATSTLLALHEELSNGPLKGQIYTDTMKAVHDALIVNVPGITGKDNVGAQKYASFVQSFIPQYLAKSRAGTLEPNALDINDPNSMISKAMAPFKRTPAERMRDFLGGLEGLSEASKATPARIETKAQYDALPKGARYIGRDGQTYEKQ